jgi:hypothetical protein
MIAVNEKIIFKEVAASRISGYLPLDHPDRTNRPGTRRVALAALGGSHHLPKTQAKPPAPPLGYNSLQILVGQVFSLPDFCHGLSAVADIPARAWMQAMK